MESVIECLQPGLCNTAIIGIIIAKGEPRCIPNRKDGSTDRYVLSLTLRDSPAAFINVQIWGGQEFTREFTSTYRIGDVIEVMQAFVQTKATDGTDEKFRPYTPSPYQLSLSENKSTVKMYGGWSSEAYSKLLHVTTKPSNDFFTLADIISNGNNVNDDHVNILAAVRSVGPSKNITSKSGKLLKRCEVKLFDDSVPSFAFILWDEELISLAQTWQPKDNVLFLADVRVTYDEFRKTMISTATAKTIITVNPDSQEAYTLYQYARTADLTQSYGQSGAAFNQLSTDLSKITDVHTIEEILEQSSGSGSGGMTAGGDCADRLCGILYASITAFNLDAESPQTVIVTRCSKCRRRVEPGLQQCMNTSCSIGASLGLGVDQELESCFSLLMQLSDHTGSLSGCSVTGDVASKMMGNTVEQYLSLSEEDRTELKWSFLLERCKFYYKVQPATPEFPTPRVVLLSCERAEIKEALKFAR